MQGYEELVKGCVSCLENCVSFLDAISDDEFTKSTAGFSSIGAHMRHILERANCIFRVTEGVIDYDNRPRDKDIENNLELCQSVMKDLVLKLGALQEKDLSAGVRVVETVCAGGTRAEVDSSLGRELLEILNHTVHHIASVELLAVVNNIHAVGLNSKAPSTIVYEGSTESVE